MSRFDEGIAVAVPPLTRISEPSNLTPANLRDTGHPVNDSSRSGKGKNMAINIDGDVWVAQGSSQAAPWRRLQWKTDQGQAILRLTADASTNLVSTGYTLLNGILAPVETFFAGDWNIGASTMRVAYTGEDEAIFKFVISGQLKSNIASNSGETISVGLFDVAANSFLTGSVKTLPVVKLAGVAGSVVNFTFVGYARVNTGDIFEVRAVSTVNSVCTANSVLASIEPLDALLYQ